jgi:hypothetical protein
MSETNETLAQQCKVYSEWITVPLDVCDLLKEVAKVLEQSSWQNPDTAPTVEDRSRGELFDV